MNTGKPLTDEDGEVRELTTDDLEHFRPGDEVLPVEVMEGLRSARRRGQQKAPTKIPATIRFDPDVLAGLKATGKDWQSRVNEVMRAWLARRD